MNERGFSPACRSYLRLPSLGHTGNTFYVSAEQNILQKVSALENLILHSDIPTDRIAELIVSARNEGLFRTIPILALALLRKRDKEKFKEIFGRVVLTGNDLKDFLDINHQIFDGFGRAVKSALHKWLKERGTEFYALKYRSQIADAISISRPKVDAFENVLILKYIYGKKKEVSPELAQEILSAHPQIAGAEKFKALMEKGNVKEAIAVATEAKLPADLMIGIGGSTNDPVFWEAIARNMGLMQFLKYLNKLTSVGLEELVVSTLKEKFTPENIRKAKIFPYRFFVAWKNATSVRVQQALKEVIERLTESVVLDERWTSKSWAVCPDISGSMTWSGNGGVRPCEVAGFFSAILGKQLGVEEILPWDTKVYPFSIESMSVFSVYRRIADADGGGTAMNKPIDYLIRERKKKDIVVIITDSEHWASTRGVKTAWREYKERIHPEAKLVVLEVVGYGHSQVDKKFAKMYDVYTVFGWSDSVFKWIEIKVL